MLKVGCFTILVAYIQIPLGNGQGLMKDTH